MSLRSTAAAFLAALALTAAPTAWAAAPTAPDASGELERARAEADRARAEADRAQAEADRARAAATRGRDDGGPSAAAEAAAATPNPGAYRRDGLFLRLSAGAGYTNTMSNGVASAPAGMADLRDPEIHGLDLTGPIALGGTIAENLILHGQLWIDGGTLDVDGGELELGTGVLGPGLTYYFMPANVFLTASAGLAVSWYHVHGEGDDERDDEPSFAVGAGGSLLVGKEWWVSENWSLGLALAGEYSFTTNEEIEFHRTSAKLLFTATFN